MTNANRVLDFLEQHPGQWFDDDQLSAVLNIRPRQQMNQICARLAREGRIDRKRTEGKVRNSWADSLSIGASTRDFSAETVQPAVGALDSRSFEELARRVLSDHFGLPLSAGRIAGTPKTFDLVSPDGSVVGDAKFYSMVRGKQQPPAKRSVIAEYVWLLEHVKARHRFLVFGNDRRVPEGWLRDYGHLVESVDFFFLDVRGELDRLSPRSVRG